MRFFWEEVDYNKYQIIFSNTLDSPIRISVRLMIIRLVGLKNSQYEDFLRSKGAKKHIDGNFYFDNKDSISSLIEQLNTLKKLSR